MNDSLSAWTWRYRLLILLVVTGIGAFLRLYQIGSLPPAAGYDAAQYGLDALEILDGARPIFLAANFGREPLFSYLVALVYVFTGPGALGIHLTSALIGTATIPAVYAAACALLAERARCLRLWVPLAAALVTAISYWHLNFSRAGLRVIWVPFFASLITAALWTGLQRGSRLWLAAAGVLLGVSAYTYQAARLLPLLVLAGFVLTFLSRRAFSREDLIDILLTSGLALLVFAPLGYFAATQPDIFNNRLQQTALLSESGDWGERLAAVASQSRAALRMFFIEGDAEPLFTIPRRPSLNIFLAAAFLAGIGICLWRWKRPSALYLLTWLALLTAPAMIADQAATAKRALGAYPAVAILAALGLVVPFAGVYEKTRGKSRWPVMLFAVAVAAGLTWTAVRTVHDYFYRWGEDPALAGHYQRDHSEIGLAAAQAPAGEIVLVSPFPVSHPAIQLNSGRRPDLRSYDGHRCLLVPGGQDGLTYLIAPGASETSVAQLQHIFPGGKETDGPPRADRDEPYFTKYHVPAALMLEGEAAESLLLNWQDEIGLLGFEGMPAQAAPGDEIVLTLIYRALADPGSDYTAYVHLRAAGGGEAPVSQADSEPCGGALPTGSWREGDFVRDTIRLRIGEDVQPGKYELVTGFYTWPDITPLALVAQERGVIAALEIR